MKTRIVTCVVICCGLLSCGRLPESAVKEYPNEGSSTLKKLTLFTKPRVSDIKFNSIFSGKWHLRYDAHMFGKTLISEQPRPDGIVMFDPETKSGRLTHKDVHGFSYMGENKITQHRAIFSESLYCDGTKRSHCRVRSGRKRYCEPYCQEMVDFPDENTIDVAIGADHLCRLQNYSMGNKVECIGDSGHLEDIQKSVNPIRFAPVNFANTPCTFDASDKGFTCNWDLGMPDFIKAHFRSKPPIDIFTDTNIRCALGAKSFACWGIYIKPVIISEPVIFEDPRRIFVNARGYVCVLESSGEIGCGRLEGTGKSKLVGKRTPFSGWDENPTTDRDMIVYQQKGSSQKYVCINGVKDDRWESRKRVLLSIADDDVHEATKLEIEKKPCVDLEEFITADMSGVVYWEPEVKKLNWLTVFNQINSQKRYKLIFHAADGQSSVMGGDYPYTQLISMNRENWTVILSNREIDDYFGGAPNGGYKEFSRFKTSIFQWEIDQDTKRLINPKLLFKAPNVSNVRHIEGGKSIEIVHSKAYIYNPLNSDSICESQRSKITYSLVESRITSSESLPNIPGGCIGAPPDLTTPITAYIGSWQGSGAVEEPGQTPSTANIAKFRLMVSGKSVELDAKICPSKSCAGGVFIRRKFRLSVRNRLLARCMGSSGQKNHDFGGIENGKLLIRYPSNDLSCDPSKRQLTVTLDGESLRLEMDSTYENSVRVGKAQLTKIE